MANRNTGINKDEEDNNYDVVPCLNQTLNEVQEPEFTGMSNEVDHHYDDFSNLWSAAQTVPPSSHSNPETPNESVFKANPAAEPMTRIVSEPSLGPLSQRHQQDLTFGYHGLPASQQPQQAMLASLNRSVTIDKSQENETSASESKNAFPPLFSPICDQAGLDFGTHSKKYRQFDIPTSNMRTSTISTRRGNCAVSQSSENDTSLFRTSQFHRSVSGASQTSMPSMTNPSMIGTCVSDFPNQPHNKVEQYLPDSWPNITQIPGEPFSYGFAIDANRPTSMCCSPLDETAPLLGNTQRMYSHLGNHPNMTRDRFLPHRSTYGPMVQQPTYLPESVLAPPKGSTPTQDSRPSTKRSESYTGLRSQRAKRPLLNDDKISIATGTPSFKKQNSGVMTAQEEQLCIQKILTAMYDTSRAQDNPGMVSTWKSQVNDSEAIEKVAHDLLETCKRRSELGRPFRRGVKPSHRFDSFEEHFDILVEALATQKTMCKHLLRQPYIEEIVDDPLGSIARIANNRKVNKGKKIAIEEGRKALGQEGQGKGRRFTRVSPRQYTDDEQDAENESFDEEEHKALIGVAHLQDYSRHQQSSETHPSSKDYKRDNSYHEGPQAKRAKRASRSKYQLNERNEMIDTSEQVKAASHVQEPAYQQERFNFDIETVRNLPMNRPHFMTENNTDDNSGEYQPPKRRRGHH